VLDPITLTVLGIFAALAVIETVRPGRAFPRMRLWRAKGVLFLGLALVISTAAPLLWDGWFAEHRLFDATGLGHVGGAIVGFLLLEVGIYLWHRALHRVPLLWRWFHQMHHSAERVDVFGAYYFHPLDVAGFALVTSACLVLVVGLTGPATVAVVLAATFCALFQHSNLKTPRWLGYIVHRPESHALHHQRDVHAFNYSDLPLVDMVFGTFRNPETFEEPAGFWDGASEELLPMLAGRDVATPPSERDRTAPRAELEVA
jgi:sterol desaturase/sphingolipid hydroxylase (fatty acid hydroxylase superfamily)